MPGPYVPRASASRAPLGVTDVAGLPTTVEPVSGEPAAMLVVQAAGEREAFVRFVDESGALGPTTTLRDEFILSAFRTTAGERALVTQRGDETCVARIDRESGAISSRGCVRIDAKALAVVGDRLAFFSLARPEKTKPADPARAALLKASPAKPKVIKKPEKKVKSPPTKKSKVTKVAPKTQKDPVEVVVRWASFEGVVEDELGTGLSFVPPMDGMSIIDATASSRGVELAWYATAKPSPKAKRPKVPPPLGWAAIHGGAIGLDGEFVTKSEAMLAEGELDWGAVRGFFSPRWIPGGRESALVAQEATRGGSCAVARPSGFGPPQRAVCAIDPGAAPDITMLRGMESLLAKEPRRAPGQSKSDAGLVVWAGDRAFFVTNDGAALRSASRDGAARDEALAFPARRGRVAWAKVFPDGTGVALANGRVFVLDQAGEARPAAAKDEIFPMARGQTGAAGGIAQIGASIWVARGDVGRVFPSPLAPEVWRGRGPVDGAALVGGASRGLSIELSGGRLRVSGLDAEGAVVFPSLSDGRPRASASPVRPGFVAAERASGGALVSGVAAADPTAVISFFVDASGRLGPVTTTSLVLREGELGLRISPLPAGGALVADEARTSAVWLDDDGREVAKATWPAGEADAVCLDGTPGRAFFPDTTPGSFLAVEALGEPGTCVVGEPVWTTDGSLRWFGATSAGFDVLPEARIVRGLGKAVSRPPAKDFAAKGEGEVRAAAPRPCPPEMVLVDGKLCVDRFEATIVDMASGEQLSPDYPVTPNLMEVSLSDWATGRARVGGVKARALPLPFLPAWQRGQKLDLVAVPRRLARPNGYVTGIVAESACVNAGKRLCTLPEFVLACRGERDTPFPYGDAYESGACNVNRDAHPAALLHDNASIGHLDPRLNRVRAGDSPLYREAGATLTCQSHWGSDAIYDMVGNLDEWVDEGAGAFAGGFYARSTRAGCDAVITAHPKNYLDYSTGVRCCKSAEP